MGRTLHYARKWLKDGMTRFDLIGVIRYFQECTPAAPFITSDLPTC